MESKGMQARVNVWESCWEIKTQNKLRLVKSVLELGLVQCGDWKGIIALGSSYNADWLSGKKIFTAFVFSVKNKGVQPKGFKMH